MRDFRDAKVMAQTLREALSAKSISITHSESLELVAKILGFHDWNVLAAKIQSELQLSTIEAGASARKANSPADCVQDNQSGKSAPQEVFVDAAILDGYAGFYQLNDSVVFTVTRDGNHLVTRLTGQGAVPIYAQSNTGFFARIIDARISFVADATGQASSLILHQAGRDIPMQRIDGATAQEIAGKTAEKVKSQFASPGTEAALHRLIDGIISGEPRYDEMDVALAEATRHQLPNLQRYLAELDAVRSVRFLGVGGQGEDVYTVRHENGASHWRIALDSKGKISTAWVTQGP
jgi:hypothetical protein